MGFAYDLSQAPTVTEASWVGSSRPLLAWYHGPIVGVRDLGVLLCKPTGYEMMCTHRAYRHLAERLASRGFPVLRFDYDGTGDSSGCDSDADRVSAWLDSIEKGARHLEQRGAGRIALFGVRFGALLAAAYAARRPVDTLVLVSPPASGKAYLRELRALQGTRGAAGDETLSAEAGAEIAGFLLSKETADRTERLSLAENVRPARRVLVVARDDLDGREAKAVDRLAELGSSITLSRTPGYAAMMQADPVASVVPEAIWKEVADWLAEDEDGGHGVHRVDCEPTTVARVCAADGGVELQEEILDLDGLFGVLTSPAGGASRSAPTILLPNVGANHHVGCNRMYVEFARHWASLGFCVLRFDLVGMGDTPAQGRRPENAVYSDFCVLDVRRAMDWLSRDREHRRFALGGICSGAYVSYYAALADDRVDCLMMMNPLTFHWHEGDSLDVRSRKTFKSTHFYRQAVRDFDTWIRAARGDVHLAAIARKMASLAFERVRRWPYQWLGADTEVAAGFRSLCDRGTRVILICSEHDGSRDVVDAQLGPDARSLRGHRNFRFGIARNADHTFSPFPARRELLDQLTAFLQNERRSLSNSLRRISDGLRSLRR